MTEPNTEPDAVSRPAYAPGARDRVARWYRDQWGYRVNNETTLRHADDALKAVRPELERLAAERDEALAALEKQQALLAGAVVIPEDARTEIRNAIANPAGQKLPREQVGDQRETVASWGARAVLKLMESWRVFSPATEAPRAQSADEEIGDELRRLTWERMVAAAPEGHKAYESVWGEQKIMRCGCGTKVGTPFAYRLHLEALAEQTEASR